MYNFNRLKTTYRQFEIDLRFEDKVPNSTDFPAKHSDRGHQMESKGSIPKIDLIEIDDSSDEEGPRGSTKNNSTQVIRKQKNPSFHGSTAFDSVQRKHHATIGNSTLTKRTKDRNESRIGSTTIKRRRFDKEISSFFDGRQTESSAFDNFFQTVAANRQQTNQHRAIISSGSNTRSMLGESRVSRIPMQRTLAETNQIANFGNIPIFDHRIKTESTSSIDTSTGTYGGPFIINKSNLTVDDNLVVDSSEIASNERRDETRSEG
ncbi:uncharacterized protein LOC116350044, partial [Contarinia nasturtii]|uniref:uncharacterized protein LOC116350044 n=1 Tax=Contarinia nasturtii TaxID=265458 RepID=UPI0012D3ADA7